MGAWLAMLREQVCSRLVRWLSVGWGEVVDVLGGTGGDVPDADGAVGGPGAEFFAGMKAGTLNYIAVAAQLADELAGGDIPNGERIGL